MHYVTNQVFEIYLFSEVRNLSLIMSDEESDNFISFTPPLER